jgi:ribosomal protein L16/L10AE
MGKGKGKPSTWHFKGRAGQPLFGVQLSNLFLLNLLRHKLNVCLPNLLLKRPI